MRLDRDMQLSQADIEAELNKPRVGDYFVGEAVFESYNKNVTTKKDTIGFAVLSDPNEFGRVRIGMVGPHMIDHFSEAKFDELTQGRYGRYFVTREVAPPGLDLQLAAVGVKLPDDPEAPKIVPPHRYMFD